jgi:hypothetical protein
MPGDAPVAAHENAQRHRLNHGSMAGP